MRIDRVIGTAFGPFRGETLEFAPGLNVVHGPNEAGKSSWFNATYTALAGRRKYKGRGSAAETEFRNRHKPWSGSKWAAGLAVTLDDDRTLAITQDLAKGEWTIVDGSTGRAISDAELLTDTSLDGTRLLGLNRHSARSTIFTGQADILRVRDDAGELQELLERAASTGATDATADAALAWLKERRAEWVGVAHGKKPLATTRAALNASREVAQTRRDHLAELHETIANRQKLAAPLVKARAKVELSERLVKWQSVYEMRNRVEKAVELSTRVAESRKADLTVDEEKVAAATNVLVVFDRGTDVVPLGEGPTAADLQAQIDELPQVPEGDREPRQDVIDAHSDLLKAQTALDTHMQATPPDVEPPPPTTLSPDELRTLADVLASPPPVVDAAAVAAFQQDREQRTAHLAALQRDVDDHDATYRQAKVDYDAAVENGGLALELAALHAIERSAAEDVIAASRRQVDLLSEALSAQENQAGVMAQEVALRQHQERVDAAHAQVQGDSLDADPEALKKIAREIDAAGAARIAAAKHADHAAEFRAARDDRVRVLSSLLGGQDPLTTEDPVAQPLQMFTDYVDACKSRAEVAQQAARRADLVEAHSQRLQLEANHRQALSLRETQGREVIQRAAALGVTADPLEIAIEQLRRWVSEQETKRAALTTWKTDVALLEQLLGGRELTDLQSELAALTADAGDEPEEPMPPDLTTFVTDAKALYDRMIDLDGQLKGKIQALGNALGSVADAVEAEADAQRAADQVETLASCLDAAAAELANAKERANASIAPALADRMRPWLPRVTNGRYRDVTVDPGDLTIHVTEKTGQVRQADRLSLGTTEQIYLLLRVTLSQVLSGGTETAPLIFDDVTTQSDTTRTVAVMELLHELSAEHQVILFSQEDEVVEWAQRNIDPTRDTIIPLPAP
ncbi:AAA family ATPase [Mycolicibacterium gilvum]|uniref:AAA family ATPase n=1 Tax=Mycolicibacterium gilvum TaxID=1804 RepID=UPI0040454186